MTQHKKVPVSRLGRFSRLAGLGVRTGTSLLLSKDPTAAAEKAAEVLGTLRGLAAKVGQMVSYIDGMVPDEQREVYQTALRSLRAAAPTSAPEAVRDLVEADLGAPMGTLFAQWEAQPFASASIGQVHRAVLHDGRAVAVKVQHPGIDRAVESDLDNAAVIQGMASMFVPRNLNPRAVFAEIKTRFREELDYGLEAERQRHFIRLHEGDPKIHIPRVIDERSSRRVLTTELAVGRELDDACADGESARRAYAETLWRFVFKSNLVGGMFNADPHPGNYLFQEDGAVAFLDFGCCQPIEGERLERARAVHRAAIAGDEQAFAQAAVPMLETRGGRYEAHALSYVRRCFEPLFCSPYLVTTPYVKSLADTIIEFKKLAMDPTAGFVQLPPGMLFMNRLQFGFYSILARLSARADYRAVEERFFCEEAIAL
jgi:predicted unusual protein kinase regulating ubiquinone biosynthesis (AarF/ABC1/UbiB family)